MGTAFLVYGILGGSVVSKGSFFPSNWLNTESFVSTVKIPVQVFRAVCALTAVWAVTGMLRIFSWERGLKLREAQNDLKQQLKESERKYMDIVESSPDGTLSGGAGLAFLIGGPVTAIPTMTMLWAIFRKKVFFLYMFISIAGTIILAYSFQFLVFVPYVDTDNPLLTGVRSLSGGNAAIITKAGKDVRIVMDPGDENMIATYNDPLAERGGVVFDAGFERFFSGRYGNKKYMENVAVWLEENSSSANSRNILIYNTFSGSGIDNELFNRNALSALQEEGSFKIKITDRKETPEISGKLLEEYGQLWLFFGETGPGCCFSDSEVGTISRFNESGGSMLIVTGHQAGEEHDQTAVNRLSFSYGVSFSGSVENEEELNVSSSVYFFSRVSEIFGRLYGSMT